MLYVKYRHTGVARQNVKAAEIFVVQMMLSPFPENQHQLNHNKATVADATTVSLSFIMIII